jgi:hypothetical protein
MEFMQAMGTVSPHMYFLAFESIAKILPSRPNVISLPVPIHLSKKLKQ